MTWLYLIASLGALVYGVIFVYKTKTGSPYLPSENEEINVIIKHLPKQAKVCDFGAGDGRLMVKISEAKPKIEVWGWEIEPLIWLVNKQKLKKNKAYLEGRLHYQFGDMWQVKFDRFDVLVVYQLERFADRLAEKCKREMKPGSLVLANTYPIKGLREINRDGKIIIYRI